MTNEEFVRAYFPDAHELKGRYGTSMVWLDKDAALGDWAAAAEFTRGWLEQIRQLEEEMMVIGQAVRVFPFHAEPCSRILARLESALAGLKRIMRTASPDGTKRHSND